MKISLTILIPAHNEEENILNIIMDVLSQNRKNYVLEKIVIVSDGSSDNTIKIVKLINSNKMTLKEYKDRKGKILRLNDFFKTFKGDYLVQLDADVRLGNEKILDKLAVSLAKGADLVCGCHRPAYPNGIIQKIGFFGVDLWEQAKREAGERARSFWCTGQIRGFSHDFISKLRYPAQIPSEDTYCFFFAASNNYKIVVRDDAWILFSLPSTIGDYIKQQKRFIGARNIVEKHFKREIVKKFGHIRTSEKMIALAKKTVFKPLAAIGYVGLQSISKIEAIFYKKTSKWDTALSARKVSK